MAQSLKKFMSRNSFDKITVREILEDADVTRPTFYYHFEDIYDLMTWMFDTELLTFLKKSEDCVTGDDGMLLVLRYVEENRTVCLCAYNSIGRDMLVGMIVEENRWNISMLEVLGYRKAEIRSMILSSNHLIVPFGFLLGVALSSMIAQSNA
ncbi:MAG: FtsX-like permease family protein [Fusicatenibacter sp.]